MRFPSFRSLFRVFGLLLAALVVLVLAAALGLRLYGRGRLAKARVAFEQQGLSLDLASYELPKVPREENAAVWLEAGSNAILLSPEDRKLVFAAGRAATMWNEDDVRRLRAFLEANRSALETLHRGGALPRFSFDVKYREGPAIQLPELKATRNATRLLLVEGRFALRDGNRKAIVPAMRTLSRLADALIQEPTLLTQVIGNMVAGRAFALAADVASTSNDPALLELAEDILPVADRLTPLRRSIGFEAAMVSGAFDHGGLFEDPITGSGSFSLLNVTGLATLTQAAILEASLRHRALVDAPLATLLSDDPEPSFSRFKLHRWMAERLTPTMRGLAMTTRLSMARRQLVAAALTVRGIGIRGSAYPAMRPVGAGLDEPNALTRLPLTYSVEADGSVRIEIPGVKAEQLREGPNPFLGLSLPPLHR